MTLQVVFRNAARTEFDLAALLYDTQRAGLGAQFVAEVDAAVRLAATHPERFPVKHADIRRAPVRRFPYSLFYRVEPGRIVVLAVFHGVVTRAFGRHAHNHAFEPTLVRRSSGCK